MLKVWWCDLKIGSKYWLDVILKNILVYNFDCTVVPLAAEIWTITTLFITLDLGQVSSAVVVKSWWEIQCSAVLGCEGVVAGAVAAVEVNIAPPSLPPLPDPGLLGLRCVSMTLLVKNLCNFHVSNRSSIIPQQVNHRVENRDIAALGLFYRIIKIKSMKLNPLDKIP